MGEYYPLIVMAIGIFLVIGMIMGLKVNAFIALITAAIVVSLMAVETTADGSTRLAGNAISRVADAFGSACGSIGIVIGLAAVIGTCMMDSGAADRVVRSFMNLLGEKRAPWALMGSGYVLAVPVFFDTVFYLLVPLARSFYKRTGGKYLLCILAITAGGAITHTLVPPTPGPLTMAATLGIDFGTMILVGAMVALPAAIAGIICAGVMDRMFDIPMREAAGHEEPEPLTDDQLPSLFASLLPVVLPVIMIAINTGVSTIADGEVRSATIERLGDEKAFEAAITEKRETSDLNRIDAMKAIDAETITEKGSPGRFYDLSHYTKIIGNPNLALLISTVIALMVYFKQRKPTKEQAAKIVEASLMSGGIIILITAAGNAFGKMLAAAEVGTAIQNLAGGSDVSGTAILFLGFGIAALLKVAQGSSTSAMIITSGMMVGMVAGVDLPFNRVYLATAIGAGSLIGSWMNDSGFWIFSKMGGLTEKEALCTWTPLLIVLGLVSMAMTLVLSSVLPMAG